MIRITKKEEKLETKQSKKPINEKERKPKVKEEHYKEIKKTKSKEKPEHDNRGRHWPVKETIVYASVVTKRPKTFERDLNKLIKSHSVESSKIEIDISTKEI